MSFLIWINTILNVHWSSKKEVNLVTPSLYSWIHFQTSFCLLNSHMQDKTSTSWLSIFFSLRSFLLLEILLNVLENFIRWLASFTALYMKLKGSQIQREHKVKYETTKIFFWCLLSRKFTLRLMLNSFISHQKKLCSISVIICNNALYYL